jgi:SAM-dependent methyltransferase
MAGLLLYDELTPWYRLLDPLEDHADECDVFANAFLETASHPPRTLLELGAGAGNNAFHLKTRFRCTLVDPSPAMLALSQEINPDCEHVLGDMRTLDLGRTFDAVLVHDGVMYLRTPEELRAMAQVAFRHTAPGGAAVVAPDVFRETFVESVEMHAGDCGNRSLRCLEWAWEPEPGGETMAVDYAFLLREAGAVRSVHDRHLEGLFPRARWVEALSGAGYVVEMLRRPIDVDRWDEVFLCRRGA